MKQTSSQPRLDGKIPGRIKYTFALGALGKDMIYGMIATFSMIYFTDIIKVNPVFIGVMFFVAKLWDAFNDLFMGMIVDNTRSRWGKFIPWLVIGTLVNSIVFVVLFTDFHLDGVGLCVFATAAYILWGMTYTIMDIPYWSIIPNLTSNPEEREKVSVLPRIFASIGQSLVIAGFGVQIIEALSGGTTNQAGYHRFAIIIAIPPEMSRRHASYYCITNIIPFETLGFNHSAGVLHAAFLKSKIPKKHQLTPGPLVFIRSS